MGGSSVQVIARFGDSVLHVWTGAPTPMIDVATITGGASTSDAKPFWLEGGARASAPEGPGRLVVFGVELALGQRSVHVVDGLRLDISHDAPIAASPRSRVLGKTAIGIVASALAHAAIAASIATNGPADEGGATDRAEALARPRVSRDASR